VEQNLRLGASVRNRDGVQHQLERVFHYFPRLLERRNQQTRTLSGGEQQMVAIGRAVMARPRLLLLDEPSGGLSPQFVNEIGTIIQALKEDGATMLMVEQNLALAFKVADRFIILRDGVVSDGGFVKSLEGSVDDIVRTIYL
jgi:branched-chain amino acid transport system ATP-binding protein